MQVHCAPLARIRSQLNFKIEGSYSVPLKGDPSAFQACCSIFSILWNEKTRKCALVSLHVYVYTTFVCGADAATTLRLVETRWLLPDFSFSDPSLLTDSYCSPISRFCFDRSRVVALFRALHVYFLLYYIRRLIITSRSSWRGNAEHFLIPFN